MKHIRDWWHYRHITATDVSFGAAGNQAFLIVETTRRFRPTFEIAADLGQLLAVADAAQHHADQHDTARRLVADAHHLSVHGQGAPGGGETWQAWEQRAEAYLRATEPKDGR